MLDEFNYTFMSARKLRERGKNIKTEYPTAEDIRRANNNTVERMKEALDLHDDSTINDLKAAVRRLADT